MRFISLMSGGIDSPVAAHLVLERGADVTVLNMDGRPFASDEETEKVMALFGVLDRLHPGKVRLIRAPHGTTLRRIKELSAPRYTCLLCKKAMLLTADLLCDKMGAMGIIMGDSMGQVASQTLENMAAVSKGIRHPIIRPLIGYDKVDIERIAREIGTFGISSRAVIGCDAAPAHPVIKAPSWRLEEEASRVGLKDHILSMLDDIKESELEASRF